MQPITEPMRPVPEPIQLDRDTTAVLVLDMSTRCDDPAETCSRLLDGLAQFLDRARAAGVPVVFTVSLMAKGTPLGEVATALKRQPDEAVLYPDGFDKFTGGELRELLEPRGITNLVITGSATNFAVMYTATAAARNYRYNVVLPLDAVNTRSPYEHEYALHQLSVLPSAAVKIRFSETALIDFH
jgi:nicotinamidase-related amidase